MELKDLDLGSMLFSLINLARKNRVILPSTVTMMARGLMTLEGVLGSYLPQSNVIQIIQDHIARQVDVEARVRREMRSLATEGHAALHGQLRASAELGEAARMLTRGQLKVNTEVVGSREPLSRLSRMVDRLTLGVVIAGLFIGSSVVYYAGIQPLIFGVPVLGFLGYVGAAALSVWLIVSILRERPPRD